MSRSKAWGFVIVASVAIAAALAASFAAFVEYGDRRGEAGALGASQADDIAIPAGSVGTVRDGSTLGKSVTGQGRGTFIVVFDEAPLATYRGDIAGIPAPGRDRAAKSGRVRLDTRGPSARAYVDYLRKRQDAMAVRMSSMAGRTLRMRTTMQHAINAVVVDLDRAEADAIRGLAGVSFVEEYEEYEVDTDRGPQLIGAEPVWNGSNPGANGQSYRGEGMVVAILDTGINFGSPSFAAVGPVDGHTHVNPLGANNYLGTCASGGVDAGRCNAKLIGGFDFVCGAPANQCGATDVREEDGFGDSEGHGSHVASTAAGNVRDAFYGGANRRISGVAPHANIIAYDVCYYDIAGGTGRCPNVSAVAAVDSLVATGIVDAVNFSIGGGAEPWTDSVSLAFLNAVEAGVYVSASAGNAGPGADTVSHLQPWVGSTAAVQHGRGGFAIQLTVTAPAPVPSGLTAIVATEGSGGTPHTGPIAGNTPLKVSPGIDTADDGCAGYPPGTFNGAIAVIRRGSCTFSTKAGFASASGAIAVVIANNVTGPLVPSVPGAQLPVFAVSQSDGDALRDFAVSRPTTTAAIGYPAVPLANTPDAIASFSSRGPAGALNVMKPDFAAPGVSVLAADAGTTITGYEGLVGLKSGTSMAAPHHTGAVALIRQARPSWSVAEVKSALALTAYDQVLATDETSPATPFDTGSGRIRVDRAINAGLVMHETGANYRAANPENGGNPAQLNQPNLINGQCGGTCAFTRTFRNPTTTASTWNLQLQGVNGTVPASITVPAGSSVSVQITLLPTGASGAWSFGNITLTPVGSSNASLRMPIAVVGATSKARLDVNGDKKSDMFWRNTNGDYAYWLMNGGAQNGGGYVGTVGAGFNIVAAGDFNGDGNVDLGWSNGNQLIITINTGSGFAAGTPYFYGPAWQPYASVDIDNDGKDDILWRQGSNIAHWLMNGSSVRSTAYTGDAGAGFSLVAAGDFNGDGAADMALASANQIKFWINNNNSTFTVSPSSFYGGGWQPFSTADFNGDGKSDVMWRQGSSIAYWLMNGASVTSTAFAGDAGAGYVLVAAGDYNGDKIGDLVFANGGLMKTWLSQNGQSAWVFSAPQAYGGGWHPIDPTLPAP